MKVKRCKAVAGSCSKSPAFVPMAFSNSNSRSTATRTQQSQQLKVCSSVQSRATAEAVCAASGVHAVVSGVPKLPAMPTHIGVHIRHTGLPHRNPSHHHKRAAQLRPHAHRPARPAPPAPCPPHPPTPHTHIHTPSQMLTCTRTLACAPSTQHVTKSGTLSGGRVGSLQPSSPLNGSQTTRAA